jgi:hypothetical protein
MYAEDIDLSYRIQQSGYKNFYLGDNAIVHFKGESMQTNKPEYVKNFYDAMKVFVQKHYKSYTAFFLQTSIGVSRILASLKHHFLSAKETNQKFNFLLVGNDEDVSSAGKILFTHNYNYQKTGDLKQAKSDASSYKNSAIVFCTGKLSYGETISFIRENKNKFAYFWHNSKSQSIAGSSYSKTAGEIYAIS